MSAKTPSPFKYRNGWRAQVTLDNGSRPFDDFATHAEAAQWIVDTLGKKNSEHAPLLDGPKRTSLANALSHYAELYTLNKGGCNAELDRINAYLLAAGAQQLARKVDAEGKRMLVSKDNKPLPKAFAAHRQERIDKRPRTNALAAKLANKMCSAISTADIRALVSAMSAEGLSDSTIQKEIALLKHLFNMAANEWNWKGFENPCKGIKLGKSKIRFVVITQAQQEALRAALAECDNPYFWPMVEVAVETTLRKGSLLAMTRLNVDLVNRVAQLPGKGRIVTIPLSLKTVQILENMPQSPDGRYFPLSGNAVDMAWDGVREKIGMPTLQFRDLRHIGATALARLGFNQHQLKSQLGHTTTRQAEVYCNLVHADVLQALDQVQDKKAVYQVPQPSAGASAEKLLNGNRARKLVKNFVDQAKTSPAASPAVEAPKSESAGELPRCEATDLTSSESNYLDLYPTAPNVVYADFTRKAA